jgi:hypothetical protein
MKELSHTRQVLVEASLIGDDWSIPNWDKRQYQCDHSTTRTKKYRKNKELPENVTVSDCYSDGDVTVSDRHGDGDVTPSRAQTETETDTDTDTDTETDTDISSADADSSAVADPSAPESVETEYDKADLTIPHERKGPAQLLALWNRHAVGTGLIQAKVLTDQRRRKAQVRLRERTLEEWDMVFAQCAQTPFLKGQNDTGWKADFDWIINKTENAEKVLMGKYAGNSSRSSPSESRQEAVYRKNLEAAAAFVAAQEEKIIDAEVSESD